MKLIVLIPSYNRTLKLLETIDSLKKHIEYDDLIVLEQKAGNPLGSGEARRRLCEDAYHKYGDGNCFLMLDDDSTFDDNSKIRWAMDYFNKYDKLAIIQTPNAKKQSKDNKQFLPILFHSFLIRSDIIGRGFNYHPTEYADEIYFSFKVWLAGYKLLRTQRAYIRHHVTKRSSVAKFGGGIEEAYKNKLINIHSSFLQEFGKFIKPARTSYRDGVLLPWYNSIKPNEVD